MRSTLFWDVTRIRLVIFYRRFGRTYRSQLQRRRLALESESRKVVPKGCPETSVNKYQSTMRNIPEERNSLTTLLNHPHFSTDVNNACRNTPTLIFMVKIKVAPVQSTKAHEGTGSTVPNIYNLDTIRRRVVSLRYHMLYPYKGPWYPLNWRLCRPYSRTVGCGEENISVPLQRTLY